MWGCGEFGFCFRFNCQCVDRAVGKSSIASRVASTSLTKGPRHGFHNQDLRDTLRVSRAVSDTRVCGNSSQPQERGILCVWSETIVTSLATGQRRNHINDCALNVCDVASGRQDMHHRCAMDHYRTASSRRDCASALAPRLVILATLIALVSTQNCGTVDETSETFASCTCDLTVNDCDQNCCCDPVRCP